MLVSLAQASEPKRASTKPYPHLPMGLRPRAKYCPHCPRRSLSMRCCYRYSWRHRRNSLPPSSHGSIDLWMNAWIIMKRGPLAKARNKMTWHQPLETALTGERDHTVKFQSANQEDLCGTSVLSSTWQQHSQNITGQVARLVYMRPRWAGKFHKSINKFLKWEWQHEMISMPS